MFNYNNAKIYGDSITNYIQIENTILTQSQIDATLSPTYTPAWDANTLFLCQFNNSFAAGSIDSLSEGITSWLIYKKQEGDTILTYVGSTEANQLQLTDYNIGDNVTYQYILFGVTKNYITQEMLINNGETITNKWQSWYIMDVLPTKDGYYVDVNNLWNFNTGLTAEALTQNVDRYTFEGFTQYPKISQSPKNYITGGINAFLSNVTSGQYIDTLSQQNAFNKFINNGNIKLLKDRKGTTMLVNTTGNNFSYIDNSPQQITQVAFTYTQVGNTKNISITGGV